MLACQEQYIQLLELWNVRVRQIVGIPGAVCINSLALAVQLGNIGGVAYSHASEAVEKCLDCMCLRASVML